MKGGTNIPENADMNNYTTPGNYYCISDSAARTLKNCPFTHAFTLKVEYSRGNSVPCQTFREYNTGITAYRKYDSSTWIDYVYFSDDSTLFTPQDVTITDGDYGQVNGNFYRIGSILIFSFYITLTKDYSTTNDTLFTFNAIRSVGRYDFPAFGAYNSDLKVIDLLVRNNSNRPNFNIGSGVTIPQSSTIFCSGAMIIADL